MLGLYNLGIKIFSLGVKTASNFNEKARLLNKGRKISLEQLKNINEKEETIWVHCASLGEFEQGRPLIEKIKKEKPDSKVVLTFFSPSGYEIRKDYEYADYVLYLPADTKRNARAFIKAFNPKVVVFIKYEFWYHYLNELHLAGVTVFLASAIFRKEHPFFKWYGGFNRKMLTFFTHLFVQDELSKELLGGINIKNVSVAGDTRFDRVVEIAQAAKKFPELKAFSDNSFVLVAGSSWPTDEKIIIDYLNKNKSIKILMAPHEIHEEHILQIEERLKNIKSVRYTAITPDLSFDDIRVVIVNTMGMLSSMYQYGDIAFIGGGFGSGIHNTIEAATFDLPVIFGPNYKKYQEACDLIDVKGGFTIKSYSEFENITDKLCSDVDFLAKSQKEAGDYVRRMCGATDIISEEILKLL